MPRARRSCHISATPELTCGPTLAHAMRLLRQELAPARSGPDASAYAAYVQALQSAYRERLKGMGDADGRRALGASGGQRIMPAVMQLLSFAMDYGMDLDAAIHQPRIDASEGDVAIGDVRLPAEARQVLRSRFDYEEVRRQTIPLKFASATDASLRRPRA